MSSRDRIAGVVIVPPGRGVVAARRAGTGLRQRAARRQAAAPGIAGSAARRYAVGGLRGEVNVAKARIDERRSRPRTLVALAVLALLGNAVRAGAADEPAGRIERIDLKTEAATTKVIIMLSRPLAFDVHVLDGEAARKSARRLVLDFT